MFWELEINCENKLFETSALAADLWQQIPKQMKDSNTFLFPKQNKKYLLLQKKMNCPNPVAFV